MNKELLQLALNNDGQVVSVYNVPTGSKCNCYFLDENGNRVSLIAKNKGKEIDKPLNPKQKAAHFARVDGMDTVSYARESMIHFLAKQFLLSYKSLKTPALTILYSTFFESQKIDFEKIDLEKKIVTPDYLFQPDAVGCIKKKELFIEFFKTHKVDQTKYEKIKKHGIACIEINLSDLNPIDKKGNPNTKGIKQRLRSPDYIKWIFNPKEQDLLAKAQAKLEEERKAERLEKEERRKEQEAYISYRDQSVNYEIRMHEWNVERLKLAQSKGYQILTVYKRVFVYCPKEKLTGRENKIHSFKCQRCEYFLEQIDDNYLRAKDVVCGFRNKITDHQI